MVNFFIRRTDVDASLFDEIHSMRYGFKKRLPVLFARKLAGPVPVTGTEKQAEEKKYKQDFIHTFFKQ